MQKVEKIEGQVMEEVNDSREYQYCANRWANESASISSTYMTIAKQELDHATKLNAVLSEIGSMPGMTDDQKAVIKFLVEMNSGQIRKASTDR